MQQQRFNAADVWEKLGITEHLGGIDATRRLARRCLIRPGQVVLDIGCGTGYTACLLAKQYGLRVVATDIRESILKRARERIAASGVGDQVSIVQANIHTLDFAAESFDVVIAESVLAFCDQQRALSEALRVLKRGGFFGDNELTYLKCPPPEWTVLLSSAYMGLNIQPLLGEEWLRLFERAGFGDVSGTISPINLRQQLADHLRMDGWRKYFGAVVRGLGYPGVRSTFVSREMMRAWRAYPSYVGFGLYVGRKPCVSKGVSGRSYHHEVSGEVC